LTSDTRTASPLEPILPRKPGDRLHWCGLTGATGALAIARAAEQHPGLVLAVTDTSLAAQQLQTELRFFAGDRLPALTLPDWETLPYDVFSPHQDIVSERIATLYRLPQTRRGVLIVPVATLMQRLAPAEYLLSHSLLLKVGDRFDLDGMRTRLDQAGYRYVSEVMEHGEFTVRGSLIDLYPMGSKLPYRIDLFDDEVDSIRTFDPENQRTLDKVERIELLPAREFPTTEADITRFRKAYRATFEGDPSRSLIYREVSAGNLPNGIEYYLPLFFEQTATLFDYLPEDALAIRVGDLARATDDVWHQVTDRYEQRRHDIERPLLAPERLFLAPDQVREQLNNLPQVVCFSQAAEGKSGGRDVAYAVEPLPDVSLDPQGEPQSARLEAFLADFPGRTLLIAETEGRREALLERLIRRKIQPTPVSDWRSFLDGEAKLALAVGALERGAVLQELQMALIPEAALYGERAQQRRRRRRGGQRDPEMIIRDLTDLSPGAPVVHEEHGVGRYIGLQTLDVEGFKQEFLTLEYAGGAKLYVPVSSLHLISRYTGAEGDHAPLHRLGTDQWEKARRKAAEKARDVAAELLDIYARREASKREPYRISEDDYHAFADAFPFEETPDQESAIEAVLSDMRSSRPMDRVVCGDVGFGKTEVAMRAAFMGVAGGRQVAVMVPTTLLAQQHFQNFRDRFAGWPVRIEALSRFSSSKEQTGVLAALVEGKVDIVIGTHKLLQDTVRFKDLGLVIIDEEHRFGVRQKEQLKKLRANVDVLTLTATPIPRTLNMALSGMRDLSIIATPPQRRLTVKTFVSQWNDNLIQEACQRELKRGGQVYFLHNEVETIEKTARELETLLPDARVRVAHGQMRERDLERVMLDFYHQRFNILVCTTIIESGIDVPSANTIVINRADRLGLAQLHQLRGRVGRSHHRAYAYLIAPPKNVMTPEAEKRLDAVASLEELGVGFALASHDLEIRGAGELLGEDQSGQIQEIGFSMYTELLERAVKALKAGKEPALLEPLDRGTEIDLRIPALLPDDYLPDVHTRLVMYKRIANARDSDGLQELQVEMIDRFGLLPPQAKNLFRLAEIRLKAQNLGLTKVEAGPAGGVLVFSAQPQVDPAQIIRLIQQKPSVFKLDGQQKLRFKQDLTEADQRVRAVEQLIDSLADRRAA
jgi:transcription-repair coupling factor (superfamily II helicase)